MNDKATEKHHWPGPGTNIGQGKQCPRAPYQHIIPHRNILQVPCLRQERGLITSSEYPAKALSGHPFPG